MRNKPFRSNKLNREGIAALTERLPPGWSVRASAERGDENGSLVEVTSPDRRKGPLRLEARSRLEPKGVRPLLEDARAAHPKGALLVVAPYLSDRARTLLRDADVGYLDLTGNVRLVLDRPGLFIETQGAAEEPNRALRPARSLRGPKAGRVVRALIDHRVAPGVRELALMTKTDAGYVSRVLAFLDEQALIKREGRGRIVSVDWPELLRRWAHDAPLESRGDVRTYLEPRGLSALVERLAKSNEQYAVTGGLAAVKLAPVASPRLATVWVRNAADAAARLALRPADAGANVLLIEPHDDGVFDGAALRDGFWCATPSQVAADLLTSTGRGPAEAGELITWMSENEGAWRK